MDQLPAILSPSQRKYIIQRLAAYDNYDQVKMNFENFFSYVNDNGVRVPGYITGDQIIEIEEDYLPEIEKMREADQINLAKRRFFHATNRLDVIEAELEDARKPVTVRSVRVGDGGDGEGPSYKEIQAKDHMAIKGYLKEAREEVALQFNMYATAIRLDQERQAFQKVTQKSFTVNVGPLVDAEVSEGEEAQSEGS